VNRAKTKVIFFSINKNIQWYKANGKTTTLSLFLDSLFPKQRYHVCEPWGQKRILSFEGGSSRSH
jgi:hypothetical protein